ncbi:hypothetical protein [Salinibius halmophilus]|uniref:hypothetical protein n=1 Tax=Salinibius halmophilus TaxID=1853216 RepID=UPI0018F5AB87|nr:hypothetical protein [Salinibius halmophilus]
MLEAFGFKYGKSGAHSARSMMIAELTELLTLHPQGAALSTFKDDIIDFNVLHKNTANSRKLTYRHLTDLYGLDDSICLYRNFLALWQNTSEQSRPLLALQLAFCRDALLRIAIPMLQAVKPGEPYSKQHTMDLLEQHNPGGYSPASLSSFAQNINGSLTQAGYLQGRTKKTRSQPHVSATNVAFALFIAHLHGEDGNIGLNSQWLKLLGINRDELIALAHNAHSRGLIKFSHASEVMEIRFPNWLTESEKETLNGRPHQ